MVRLRTALFVALALLGSASRASADLVFTVNITHGQEFIPPDTLGTPDRGMSGFATLVLNDAQTALTYDITLFGIDFGGQTPDPTDNMTAAHIHPTLASASAPASEVGPAAVAGGAPFGTDAVMRVERTDRAP